MSLICKKKVGGGMYKWQLMEESISLFNKLSICKFILCSSKYSKGEQVKKFERKWGEWLEPNTTYL